jgi:hypothetical protein
VGASSCPSHGHDSSVIRHFAAATFRRGVPRFGAIALAEDTDARCVWFTYGDVHWQVASFTRPTVIRVASSWSLQVVPYRWHNRLVG